MMLPSCDDDTPPLIQEQDTIPFIRQLIDSSETLSVSGKHKAAADSLALAAELFEKERNYPEPERRQQCHSFRQLATQQYRYSGHYELALKLLMQNPPPKQPHAVWSEYIHSIIEILILMKDKRALDSLPVNDQQPLEMQATANMFHADYYFQLQDFEKGLEHSSKAVTSIIILCRMLGYERLNTDMVRCSEKHIKCLIGQGDYQGALDFIEEQVEPLAGEDDYNFYRLLVQYAASYFIQFGFDEEAENILLRVINSLKGSIDDMMQTPQDARAEHENQSIGAFYDSYHMLANIYFNQGSMQNFLRNGRVLRDLPIYPTYNTSKYCSSLMAKFSCSINEDTGYIDAFVIVEILFHSNELITKAIKSMQLFNLYSDDVLAEHGEVQNYDPETPSYVFYGRPLVFLDEVDYIFAVAIELEGQNVPYYHLQYVRPHFKLEPNSTPEQFNQLNNY